MEALILLRDWQASQVEFWRVVPGYSEYDVSSFGRIRSWVGCRNKARRQTPRLLKPYTSSTDYLMIKLRRADGRYKHHGVHRLVALAFIPNPDRLAQANHLTGLKIDCRVDGLEWQSKSGNAKHAWRIGLISPATKESMVIRSKAVRKLRRTIPDDTIRRVRRLFSGERLNYSEIGRQTALHFATVRSIVVGEIYKDVA